MRASEKRVAELREKLAHDLMHLGWTEPRKSGLVAYKQTWQLEAGRHAAAQISDGRLVSVASCIDDRTHHRPVKNWARYLKIIDECKPFVRAWIAEHDAVGDGTFREEISRRKYPKALRPQRVMRADGAWMTWDKWLKSPSLDMDALLFEDGVTVAA